MGPIGNAQLSTFSKVMSVNVSLKRWGGMEGEARQVDSPVSVTFGRALPDRPGPTQAQCACVLLGVAVAPCLGLG